MPYDDYGRGDPPPPPPPPHQPSDRKRQAARRHNDWRRSEGDPRSEEGERNGDYQRWRAYLRERFGGDRDGRTRGDRSRGAGAPSPGREYSGGFHSREDNDFGSEQGYESYRGNRDWDDRGYGADYPSRYGSEGDPSGFADYDSGYVRRPAGDRELGGRRARPSWGGVEDSDTEHAYVDPSYRYGGFGLGREHSARRDFAGRGPKNYRRSDERITDDVNEALTRSPYIDATDVDVRVEGGAVTLIGSVDDRGAKRLAEDIAESCFGVRDVSNQLKVGRDRAPRGD
jgi:BON domain